MAKSFLHTASRVRTNLPHTIPPPKPPCQPCSDHQVIFRSNSSLGQASLVSALWSSLPECLLPHSFRDCVIKSVSPTWLNRLMHRSQGWGWGLASPVFPWCLTHDRCSINTVAISKHSSFNASLSLHRRTANALFLLPPAPPWKLANTKHYHFPQLNSYGKESTSNVEDLGSIPGSGRSLEKEIVTQSSILAWEIPGTEEPGGLQSLGSKKLRHNLATKTTTKQDTLLLLSFQCLFTNKLNHFHRVL